MHSHSHMSSSQIIVSIIMLYFTTYNIKIWQCIELKILNRFSHITTNTYTPVRASQWIFIVLTFRCCCYTIFYFYYNFCFINKKLFYKPSMESQWISIQLSYLLFGGEKKKKQQHETNKKVYNILMLVLLCIISINMYIWIYEIIWITYI